MNSKCLIFVALAAPYLASFVGADTVNYEYDPLHRLVHVTYDSGAWIRYEYDAVGNRLLDVSNATPGVGYLYAAVEPPGSGGVERIPDDVWYDTDETIDVTAVPVGACDFDHWSGDVPPGHEYDNPLAITMSSYGYMRLFAHFDSPFGRMDEDCDGDDTPDGCEWADSNGNEVLDDCDPLIARSTETLEPECDYGEIAPDQFFDVWNGGLPGTVLNYAITVGDCSPEPCWLWVDPADGTSHSQDDQNSHTVHYQTTTLLVGRHSATITISDPGAGNNEQSISVALEVHGRAAVCRDTRTLTAVCEYGEAAEDQFFDVWNCGPFGTTLSYDVQVSDDWLTCDPPQGSSTGEPDEITVHFDTMERPAGLYFATITVADPEAAYSPQTVSVVPRVACPADDWLPWDMNYDGFISLIGDVPPFVDCVYFADCNCPGPGCLCPGDCNSSGFLSIVGDLDCFVDCVYFDDCDIRERERESHAAAPAGTFTVGGAVYADLYDPLGSGLEGVRIRLVPLAVPVLEKTDVSPLDTIPVQAPTSGGVESVLAAPRPGWTATTGAWGVWQIDDVPSGRYRVTATRAGYQFDHLEAGMVVPSNRLEIVVGERTQAANESVQFVAR